MGFSLWGSSEGVLVLRAAVMVVSFTVALAGGLGALEAGEEGLGGGGVVDGFEDDALAVGGAGGDGVDGVGGPVLGLHLGDFVEEVGARGDVFERAGGEGVADGGVVIAEKFLGDVAGAGEPGDVVVVDPARHSGLSVVLRISRAGQVMSRAGLSFS